MPRKTSFTNASRLVGFFRVETDADLPQQFIRSEWFFYEVWVPAQRSIITQDVVGIAAAKDYLQLGFLGPHLVKQRAPTDTSRHDHIGHDELNRLMMFPPDLQRTTARHSRVDPISLADQCIFDRASDGFFIFN